MPIILARKDARTALLSWRFRLARIAHRQPRHARARAQPWRFGAVDYAAAVRSVSSLGQPLKGKTVDALWDPSLATVMQQHRISIAEEALADSLLQDLDNR